MSNRFQREGKVLDTYDLETVLEKHWLDEKQQASAVCAEILRMLRLKDPTLPMTSLEEALAELLANRAELVEMRHNDETTQKEMLDETTVQTT